MPCQPTFRPLNSADKVILWTMLMHAAHETELEPVKKNPDLARYVQGWPRHGDIGYVAEHNGKAVGAAWVRLWSPNDKGYGYVADDIPELAIAVVPARRGQGIGTQLLEALLSKAATQFPAMALSVRDDNPALRLYQRLGFEPLAGSEVANRVGGRSFTMVRSF